MKVTLVQVTKTHAWSIGLKGYIFQVVPHESENKKDNKKYWQVLNGDYTYNPIGVKSKKTKSCYLLSRNHVKVVGALEV